MNYMVNKKHRLFVEREKNIDKLVGTIVEIMPQIDIKIVPTGGARGGLLRAKKADSSCEFLDNQNRKVGSFNFERMNGTYFSELDLTAMPDDKYDVIMGVISKGFSKYLQKNF